MHTLCPIDDIPEPGSKGFKFPDKSLFAVRARGKVFVYQNSCPHLGIELNWQEDQFLDYDDALIQCATHGALFIIESGQCIAGPCHGKALEKIACKIENGYIVLTEEYQPNVIAKES